MERREELLDIFKDIDDGKHSLVIKLIDDVVFMEARLEELRLLPFVVVHPSDPAKQKPTAAAKLYKETLQQYNNAIKLLVSVLNKNEGEEISPLREYMARLNG